MLKGAAKSVDSKTILGEIRTHNLWLRRPALYPIELRGRKEKCGQPRILSNTNNFVKGRLYRVTQTCRGRRIDAIGAPVFKNRACVIFEKEVCCKIVEGEGLIAQLRKKEPRTSLSQRRKLRNCENRVGIVSSNFTRAGLPCQYSSENLPQPMTFSALQQRIKNKTAKIGIIGLGYVGLPLVRAYAQTGFKIIGYDVDPDKIEKLKAGRSYIEHIPSDWIAHCVKSNVFDPTADMGRLGEADALLICVPTPLSESRDPDLYYVESTTEAIAATLRPGQLVVLESTTYPGTTRDVLLPILEKSGLRVGKDFFLAYSPEREDPGNLDFTAEGIPKLIGGIDPESGQLAVELYSQAIAQVIAVSSCEVAEAAKVVENTYRSVNIAMVNELKIIFDRLGIDVWEVIDAAKTKPFGFQAFYPGPGLGGHCIPIDPFYLSWCARRAGLTTRFIELAGEINTSMPLYVVRGVIDALNHFGKALKGSQICVLGVAYKKDVDDPRESPAFAIIDRLLQKGSIVSYNDPHIPALPKMRHWPGLPAMKSVELTPEFLASQDCVLIATDHSRYDYDFIVRHAKLVVDTRNATKGVMENRHKIVKT